MRRVSVLLSVLVVALLGLVGAFAATGGVIAQEGTPPAEEFAPPEGVRFEPLAFGRAETLPSAPAELALVRFGLDPGAGFPIEAGDPSIALAYVESGTFTFRMEGPIQVIRGAAMAEMTAAFATPGAEPAEPEPEEIPAGTEFTLGPGDSALFPPNVAGEVRNDGQERAVALITFVGPEPTDTEATPAA